MTADGPTSDWANDVVKFLSENLYRETDEGWDHCCSSAYQMGCEAIIALGQADETDWGAARRKCPELPSTLPRWDDICIAVLGLVQQNGKLVYFLSDGGKPLEGVGWTVFVPVTGTKPVAMPNIAATGAAGPAKAAPDVLPVLESLGIVAGGRWTDAAELVLWREQPNAWSMEVPNDPRFAAAVQKAVSTTPDDIRAKMTRLTTVTDDDVAAACVLHSAFYKEMRDRYGPKARISPTPTVEIARSRLVSGRQDKLDWLFFRRWRPPDGWLSEDEAKRALYIFHDPLAIQIRRAVVEHLHPDRPEFSTR